MSSATDAASRLAFHVKWRRGNLALNQMEVWRAGGPSNTTLTEIENGRLETLTNATAKKLDAGLQWEPGSALRVWRDEGRPTPVAGSVGAVGDDAGYVSRAPRTGEEEVEDAVSDDAVLRAIQQMQRDMQAMEERLRADVAGVSERVAKLEQSGS